MVHEYCFDGFFIPAQRSSNVSCRVTDFVQRRRVACVQCTESQMNNKKEYTEIYSSLSLNHRQQQHRRHSLLHVWHHRRNKNTLKKTKLMFFHFVSSSSTFSDLQGLFVLCCSHGFVPLLLKAPVMVRDVVSTGYTGL